MEAKFILRHRAKPKSAPSQHAAGREAEPTPARLVEQALNPSDESHVRLFKQHFEDPSQDLGGGM